MLHQIWERGRWDYQRSWNLRDASSRATHPSIGPLVTGHGPCLKAPRQFLTPALGVHGCWGGDLPRGHNHWGKEEGPRMSRLCRVPWLTMDTITTGGRQGEDGDACPLFSSFLSGLIQKAKKTDNTLSIPRDSPLSYTVQIWASFRLDHIKKNPLMFPCDTAWPQYKLGHRKFWQVSGSLNYNTILQLDLFYKKRKSPNPLCSGIYGLMRKPRDTESLHPNTQPCKTGCSLDP